MQFDNILVHIGAFGKFQKVFCILVSLVAIPCAWHAIAQVFLAAETDHWCAVPAEHSLNCTEETDPKTEASCWDLQKEQAIPFKVEEGEVVYSKCKRYVAALWGGDPGELNGTLERDASNNETTSCDGGWAYDRSQYHTTIIQDFNLVCYKKELPGLAQSVFFAGLLTGSFIWGAVADWCGRKLTFFISLILASVICTVTSFVPSFAAYTALRFIIAGANFGVYLIGFVLVSEIVGPAYRSFVGTLLAVFFSVGYALLAVIAYLLREWRHLQLAISLPWFLFFLLLFVIPESPRWLIAKKKYKQAEKVIRRIAKSNGVQPPENMFREEEEAPQEIQKNVLTRQPTQIDLFRTPNMRKKTLNIFFNWFVNSLVYYGLSLSTSALGVDDYVAAFVSGAVELPGYLSSWLAIQKFGRRLPLFLYLFVGGVACLITIFIEPGAARATVAMVGKFAISGSFNIIYIYSVELYPTPVRSMGMGMSSMSARLSGVIAPVILILGKYWEPIPLVVFGGCSLLAGFLALLLPETLNHALPETVQEGEEFGKGQVLGLRTLFQIPRGPPADENKDQGETYKPIPTDEVKESPGETSPV
ncbi:organic cation transporter protein-like [Patiria miniata]|uniref:Major facilitator superfamily (MFS) profile domain-containing protein n=1 Tax=Patiria miniata TaxID=46514 RepID=A0A914A4C4_PATMI|nr:organic cation transporter protein-like [Patiria miniata]